MKFNLIFGSETGTARGLIGQLSNQILALNNESTEQIEIERFSMEEFVKNLDNKEANNLIIICSSTGDGDPPEDSLRFASKLNDLLGSGQKSLAHINFALLGLGDSEYENFGFYPKFVYHGLVQLGAQPKFRFDIADDDSNADAVIEAWLDDILPLVKSWNSGTIPATIHTQPGNSTNGEASANAEAVEATTITINLQDTVISDPNEPLNHPLPRNYDQPIKLDLTELQKLTAISGFPKNPAELINFSLETKQESQNQLSDLEVQLKSHPTAFIGHLTSVESLTASTAVKRTLIVNVQLPEDTEPFLPGDAYGICCPNDTELVDRLLTRLQVPIDNWDQIIKIEPKPNTVLPSHLMNLPQNLTLKQIFVNYLDLNAFPKKAWFRMLADSTSDNNQKQILLAMVSKQGGNLYNQLKGLNPSILDILTYFNTAQPTIERLLDTLPQLQPRYYSAANSPLSTPNQLRLAFNVIQYSLDSEAQYLRHGLCTPWLDQITGHVASNSSNNLNEPHPICLFRKQSQTFHLPTQTTKPVLMIGPGTGVAPFIGFLQHRHYQRKLKKKMGGFSSSITEELKKSFGKMWLIFGTRDPKKDYLFEKELESYLEDGTLSQLNSCFSRLNPNEEIKYVQHVLLQNKEKVFDFITKEGGYIYICGDAKNMAKDVHQALIEILQGPEELNRTKLEATQLLMEFTQEGRYLRDLWA